MTDLYFINEQEIAKRIQSHQYLSNFTINIEKVPTWYSRGPCEFLSDIFHKLVLSKEDYKEYEETQRFNRVYTGVKDWYISDLFTRSSPHFRLGKALNEGVIEPSLFKKSQF